VRSNYVVIEHPQGTKLDVRRIVILAKRKQPVCFELAKVRKVACICTNDLDHKRVPFCRDIVVKAFETGT
jgi:hypothetical protein